MLRRYGRASKTKKQQEEMKEPSVKHGVVVHAEMWHESQQISTKDAWLLISESIANFFVFYRVDGGMVLFLS